MAIPRGHALYKKRDGIITLSEDKLSLIWSPLPGTGPPVVSLAVANITNLQQTPQTAAKVILKVFEKPRSAEGEPVSYLFHFTSPTEARSEANAVKDLLSRMLAEARGDDPNLPRAANGAAADQNGSGGGGASAAMAFSSAANAKPPPTIRWFDDDQLKADVELQQSLMKKDRDLAQTYADARASKPDSISDATFNAQFWSTRVGLLRAHAIELNQKKGAYNVLSTIKPRTENGELKLNISVEQVQMIFQQHPLVKRIYNENVPKLSEGEFWSRFFLSRLSKNLRGERVTENDNTDPLFDKYNGADNTLGYSSRIMAIAQHVPQIINIEGNEENRGGFKSGNRPDAEMRPRQNVPIVKTLNSLSEKIMANVEPADDHQDPTTATATESNDLDNATFSEVSLRDLKGDAEANRIKLSVKEQAQFLSKQVGGGGGAGQSEQDAEAAVYAEQNPADVLFEVQADLETLDEDGAGGLDLHKSIGVDDDSDSDHDDDKQSSSRRVGSRAARKAAQKQILEGMRQKRAQMYGDNNADGGDEDASSPMSIPSEIAQRCYLTNATTTEFLKQFWSAFLSGDPERVNELAYHAESLARSVERIEALATEAEHRRDAANKKRKAEIIEHHRRTNKKLKWVPAGGGKEAVLALFEATLTSLKQAMEMYNTAVNEGQ
ncbi:hypothetical protein QBC46DRAFT_3521 [Diplogelasinospora grovesii]|uniref:BSD domain-containing protein n=1 Tax=Diplogelasinospora grovesii TaxID=303347 RepID=A0AAN6SAQ6_9PEZI|nr:hypothetical protein QBC46DRAFT_3521 [Diplogelasinospora grovesii]